MVPIGTLMVTYKRTLRCGLPVDRQQGVEVVLGGHSGQAAEDVAEVGHGVDAVALTGDDDRVDDRRALAGVGVADKQPVLLADRRRSDRIFNEVVVETRLAVFQMPGKRLPVFEEVIAGLSEAGLR